MDACAYWTQLFDVVRPFNCWLRVAWRERDSIEEGQWGQLLLMPVEGYLEGPDGPWPLRDVKWVDVSMSYLTGGMSARPLRILDDRKEQILAGLRTTQLEWKLRHATWSVDRLFENNPVEMARVVNPFFGPTPDRDTTDGGFDKFSD